MAEFLSKMVRTLKKTKTKEKQSKTMVAGDPRSFILNTEMYTNERKSVYIFFFRGVNFYHAEGVEL